MQLKNYLELKMLLFVPSLLLAGALFAQIEVREDVSKTKEEDSIKTSKSDTLTDAVKLPEFPGGKAEMFKYLMTSIKYPKSAKLDDAQGIVLVGFIVDRDGSIQDIEIVESVRQDLDTEAIRVIKAMPNWIPGEQNGEPIPVSYKLPVRFSL